MARGRRPAARGLLAGRLGGQGVVCEAYAGSGRRAAIKVLHGPRTWREASAAQRVASFCTAEAIEARLEEPKPYIARA
ncbi:hypothetical protein [Nonomuraea sp. SYSU D8015]|uniref:hypothetical protein n=1 Tax=Nonomuraea sp. SYSU D8015 TaxID=2593644 RepID=UPI0016610F59|nr:hypothetical protein [Nonomuraea sp. SYSU D8015]